MKKRDEAIIQDMYRFRAMTRDDIIALHFSNVKRGVNNCNTVMKRLRDNGEVDVIKSVKPFIYVIPHKENGYEPQQTKRYLELVSIYREMRQRGEVSIWETEPQLPGLQHTPDAIAVWNGRPYFVETSYSASTVEKATAKIKSYQQYWKQRKLWREEGWHKPNQKSFPHVILITSKQMLLTSHGFRIYQGTKISMILDGMQKQQLLIQRMKQEMSPGRLIRWIVPDKTKKKPLHAEEASRVVLRKQ